LRQILAGLSWAHGSLKGSNVVRLGENSQIYSIHLPLGDVKLLKNQVDLI
jgi:hypothetical protein